MTRSNVLSPTRVAVNRTGGWVPGTPCAHCRRNATRVCDYLVDALNVCGQRICKAHSRRPALTADVDFCPDHARAAKGLKLAVVR